MAKFRAGDRVKLIEDGHAMPRGTTGTIIDPVYHSVFEEGPRCKLRYDGYPNTAVLPDDWWHTKESALEPLTPPAIDTWAAERVRKVTKPEPQPIPLELADRLIALDRK